MKKLLFLPIISLLIVPTSFVSAFEFADNSIEELISNTLNANSADFNIDVNYSTKNTQMTNPVTMHADIDGQFDSDHIGSMDIFLWMNNQLGQYSEYSASTIVTENKIYFSEDQDDWYFTANELSSYMSASDDSEEEIEELADMINGLIDDGVIKYKYETLEYINGKVVARYAYEFDMDNVVEAYLENYNYSETEMDYVHNAVDAMTVKGNIWIDTDAMLPVMFTLNVDNHPSETTYTTFEFSILFNSFNKEVKVSAPSIAVDIEGYDSNKLEEFFTSNYKSVVDGLDSDADGLTNEQESSVWFTDPTDSDSDNDGFKDGVEVENGYNPNGKGILDSDNDGLTDYNEMTIHWTDRFDADSDNDGYKDGLEIAHGYDPNGPGRW